MYKLIPFIVVEVLMVFGGLLFFYRGFSRSYSATDSKKNNSRILALILFATSYYFTATILVWAIEESSETPLEVLVSILLRSFVNPGIIPQVAMALSWFVEIILTALLLFYFLKKLKIII